MSISFLIFQQYCFLWASLAAEMVKNLPAVWETWVWSLGWEDPLEEGMVTPVFWPGEPHGQRSLVGCSPWVCKQPDLTEQLSTAHIAFMCFLPLHPPGVHVTQVLFLLMVSCYSHRLSSALFLWWDNFKCPVIASLYCMVSSDFKALYWIFRAQSLYSLDRGLLYGLFLMVPIFCWSHFVHAVFPPDLIKLSVFL